MQQAAKTLPQDPIRVSVLQRVERDIAHLTDKIHALEQQPHANDQLLAAYRLMLQTRTEVLACLTGSDDQYH